MENNNQQKSALDMYGFDMTERARDRKYDPVIGRDREIRDAIMILSRKTKNNPVLIGKPGVGKSAIVEGLAERIVKGDVPQSLKNKKLYNIDISSIVAGAKFAGEFEERLKSVLEEVKKREGEIILFIDELHTIVGAGGNGGSIDAGNMLKPMLARGELHLIGATTLDEYRKYIESDKALERRFQQVMVDEPTVEDTISILRGIKDRYEMYHGVKIKDNSLIAAAELSNRYITSRFLPDKAIDLVDEACAMIKTELDSMPQELDDTRRKIMQMKIEELALKKEKDDKSKERLKNLQNDIKNIEDDYNIKLKKWEDEKKTVENLKVLSEKIDNIKKDIEIAENEANLEKASKLKYQDLPALEKELNDKEKSISSKELELLHNEVDVDEICKVISKWTGIPLYKLTSSEKEKVLNLESDMKKRVYGQDEAIKKVADAILRSKAGIKDPKKPIGSFLFLGPTGVGKTELAKTIAYNLFDDENMMVRIDMSEYMEKHSVSRLVGSPPGYVGYDEGGQLTEAVRRKPYSVILFDEVEKAHPEVFNILLQVLDDGRLTDSKGTTVDFKNTIIIFTSNIASDIILDGINDKGEFKENIEKEVSENLKNYFKPEFINRLDETIIFKPLNKDNIYAIIDLILSDLNMRLKDKNVVVSLTEKAKKNILENGYEANFGARPLKRYIQATVENMVAKAIIEGKIKEGETIVDEKDGGLYIK